MEDDTQDEFAQAFAEANGHSEPATTEQVEPEAKTAAAPADEPAPNEPGKGEVERLRAELAESRHAERSSANRISTYARENTQLRKQVDDLGAELQVLKAKKPEPAAASTGDVNDVLAEAPDLQAAVERRIEEGVSAATAPLLQKLERYEELLSKVGKQVEDQHEAIAPIRDQEAKRHQTTVFSALDEEFTPAWRTTVQSAEYRSWLERQPQAIQWLHANGSSAADGATVLRLFFAEKGAPKQPANTPSTDSKNERLRAAASGVPSRAAPRASGPDPNDYHGAFAEFSRSRQTKQVT